MSLPGGGKKRMESRRGKGSSWKILAQMFSEFSKVQDGIWCGGHLTRGSRKGDSAHFPSSSNHLLSKSQLHTALCMEANPLQPSPLTAPPQ